MKKIGEFVKGAMPEQNCPPGRKTSSMNDSTVKNDDRNGNVLSTPGLTDAMILRLWTKMTTLYGHKWKSTYGPSLEAGELTEAAQDWKRGLQDVTPRQVAMGLDKCLTRGDAWPPSLPEFRELCGAKAPPPPPEINAAAYKEYSQLALPKPKASRDNARPYLQSLRAALKGQTAE